MVYAQKTQAIQALDNAQAFGPRATRIDSAAGNASGVSLFRMDDDYVSSNRIDSSCGAGIQPYGGLTQSLGEIVRTTYAPLTANKIFPISRRMGWAKRWQMSTVNSAASARIICCTNDFPRASLQGTTFESGVITIGAGYERCYTGIKEQAFSNGLVDEEQELAEAAIRAIREACNSMAFKGSLEHNILGITNNPFIPQQISPFRMDNSVTNTQAILSVLTEASSLGFINSGTAARMPNVMVGPPSLMQFLARRPIGTTSAGQGQMISILQQLAMMAPNLQKFVQAPELESVGPAGERAVFFLHSAADSIEWHYPIALDVLEPHWDGFSYRVNMIARTSSVWAKRPEEQLLLLGV